MINLNSNLIDLANLLKPKADLFIVGGFIRDTLLNKKPNDIDLTSLLTVDELIEFLNGSKFKIEAKNKQFGTAKIVALKEKYEYTTFRSDTYYSGKHAPKAVIFVPNINEDYKRRDFTINAIYYNILKNEYFDPANGIKDLNQKVLREINAETLKFDGERILRLIKYYCELNLKIDKLTLIHAKQYSRNVYLLNQNMLNSYKQLFLKLPFFKKIRAKKLLKKLDLLNLLK